MIPWKLSPGQVLGKANGKGGVDGGGGAGGGAADNERPKKSVFFALSFFCA